MLQSLSGNNLPTSKGHRRQEGTGIAHTGYYRQARSLAPVCFNLFRVMIPTPQRNTGGQATQGATTDRRATARPLAPVTDIGANTYRPLATAHRLAPVAPVCFNLFRVITYQPQRDTGDRGDRDSIHRLLPTGSLLYVCASSSGRHHREGQGHRRTPTGSLLYVCASSSGGRHHREDRNTGEYRQARSLAPVCFNLFRVAT